MGRPHDPARATRARLGLLERRDKAKAEARQVADGVAETVALSRRRGASFDEPGEVRGERETAYRRVGGLEWLTRKGRISARQAQAGERYGQVYRRAEQAPAIGSSLDVQPGRGDAAGPPLAMLLKQGAGRQQAEAALARYRRQLMGQADLISACDQVCGRELTPREAAGGERHAARLEAVLKVALDILIAAASDATPRRS